AQYTPLRSIKSCRNRHILVKFLRFSAREVVLRTARKKGYTEWKGQRIFSQDLSRDTIQKRKKYDKGKRPTQKYIS
uniref:L1 transposable element RRM domain-containing protein n=1 Tax=Myripristis murdjan TaxID=586833 RepID=A0A667X5S7_9TELE